MWQDKKVEDMTIEEAREAVLALRKCLVAGTTEHISKPPLGCKPACISSVERMQELAEAISRQLESDIVNEQLIKRWATEILFQCEIMVL